MKCFASQFGESNRRGCNTIDKLQGQEPGSRVGLAAINLERRQPAKQWTAMDTAPIHSLRPPGSPSGKRRNLRPSTVPAVRKTSSTLSRVILPNEVDFCWNDRSGARRNRTSARSKNLVGVHSHIDHDAKERKHHLLPGHFTVVDRLVRVRIPFIVDRIVVMSVHV
jgi:hypothetical protein